MSLYTSPNWTAVVRHEQTMLKRDEIAIAGTGEMLRFLKAVNTRYATKGPATPIEKIFAPKVVSPPDPKSTACNNRTTAAITDVMAGPNTDPLNPFPSALEVVPVTNWTPKNCITNINTPLMPKTFLDSGTSLKTFIICLIPITMKINDNINHIMHQCNGKNPSTICISYLQLKIM